MSGEGWGGTGALSPMETMFWRSESDENLRMTIVAIEVLAGTPEWETVVSAHERAVAAVPRLRERVVESALPTAAPRWAAAPCFSLGRHLRQEQLPCDADFDDVFDVASRIAVTPFDRTLPPWEAVLLAGLPDGRSAYILKLHHSATDGMGVVQLLGHVHDQEPERERGRASKRGSSTGAVATCGSSVPVPAAGEQITPWGDRGG